MARHADKEFRQSAAERTTSPATVRKLADDPEYKVREAIAARDDLTAELFELLASDSSVNVRLAVVRQVVCEHENATEELLERMCHDSEVSVAEAAWKALRERASDAVE